MKSEETQIKGPRLEKPVRITDQIWPEGTMPVVSVFCITYNHVNFIRDAIEGFLMQETTFPVEIFIHDDASTDGTAEIVQEYAEKYPNLFWTVLQTENQWSTGNRKILFEHLAKQRGEYVAHCEGDDYWIAKDKLEKQVNILDNDLIISIVFNNAWCKYIESKHDYFLNKDIDKKRFNLLDIIERDWIMATSSLMHRKLELIPNILTSFAFAGDKLIQLFALMKGDAFYYDKVCSVYRIHSGGITSRWKESEKNNCKEITPNMLWMYFFLQFNFFPDSAKVYVDKLMRSYIKRIAAYVVKNEKLSLPFFLRDLKINVKKIINSSRPNFYDYKKDLNFFHFMDFIEKECVIFWIQIPKYRFRELIRPCLVILREWIRS
jgi:glycosyltransferase involved in cell wall biosynthesis